MTLRLDGLDAGDIKFKPGHEVPLETDGTGAKGEPMTFDAEGKLTPAGPDDLLVGQLGEESRWDGHAVNTRVAGLCVVADADGEVSAGDYVEPSGDGGFSTDAEGGAGQPFALHDADDGETVVLCYR